MENSSHERTRNWSRRRAADLMLERLNDQLDLGLIARGIELSADRLRARHEHPLPHGKWKRPKH